MCALETVPLIERAAIQELVAYLDDDAFELFSDFIDEAPAQVKRLQREGDNIDVVTTICHTLKSSAAYVGAKRLSQQSREIELRLRKGSGLNEVATLLSRLPVVLEESLVALQKILEELRK